MKKCVHCGIIVETDKNYCPLCFNEVTESVEDITKKTKDSNTVISDETCGTGKRMFATQAELTTEKRTKEFLLKLFLFLSLTVIAVVGLIDYSFNGISWSYGSLVFAGILYVWILVGHTIMTYRSTFEKILLQLVGLLSALFVCNKVSGGENWLLYYVIPSVIITVCVVFAAILWFTREKSPVLSFFFFDIILLVLTIIIGVKEVEKPELLYLLSGAACVLGLADILLFHFANLKTEFSKKFHL